jgi:hypothetical protein
MKLQPVAVAALIFVVCLVIRPPGAERQSSEDDVLTDANRTSASEHSDAGPNIDAVHLGGLGMGDGGGGGGGGGGMGGSAHGTGSFSFVVDVEKLVMNVGVMMNSIGELTMVDVTLPLNQLLTHASITLGEFGAQRQRGSVDEAKPLPLHQTKPLQKGSRSTRVRLPRGDEGPDSLLVRAVHGTLLSITAAALLSSSSSSSSSSSTAAACSVLDSWPWGAGAALPGAPCQVVRTHYPPERTCTTGSQRASCP